MPNECENKSEEVEAITLGLFSFGVNFRCGERAEPLYAAGTVAKNGVLVVQGPSGAGKSTLLRVLGRLRAREGGYIRLMDKDDNDIAPPAWRRRVHYNAQQSIMFEGTVMQNILSPFSLATYKDETPPSRQNMQALLAEVLCPFALDQDAKTLSGGEMARVALIRSLLAKPQLLLLDEPTAALDDQSRQATLTLLRRWVGQSPERGLVLVSHIAEDMAEFANCSTLVLQARNHQQVFL